MPKPSGLANCMRDLNRGCYNFFVGHIHREINRRRTRSGSNSVWVAIGANLPGANGIARKDRLLRQPPNIAAHDLHIHITKPTCIAHLVFRVGQGPISVNAAFCCRHQRFPQRWPLEQAATKIEDQMGRRRQTRWGARVIDMDLLGYGERVLPDRAGYEQWAGLDAAAQSSLAPDALILPHPRLHERAFVLVPLMDIAPDWVHPVLGQSVRQMHAALYPAELEEIHRLVD